MDDGLTGRHSGLRSWIGALAVRPVSDEFPLVMAHKNLFHACDAEIAEVRDADDDADQLIQINGFSPEIYLTRTVDAYARTAARGSCSPHAPSVCGFSAAGFGGAKGFIAAGSNLSGATA